MKIVVMITMLLLPVVSHANMYKCSDANGKLSFQDRPCSKSLASKLIETDIENKARTYDELYAERKKKAKAASAKREENRQRKLAEKERLKRESVARMRKIEELQKVINKTGGGGVFGGSLGQQLLNNERARVNSYK